MARSIWKGDISFGLVSIPVSLMATEENHDIHFHLLNSKTNARIRYERVDEETGKEVPWGDIVKGYEYEKGRYLVVAQEAFEQASPELFKTIDIEEFVARQEIDILFYTTPYYLIPEGKNKKAYVLLREALKKTHKVGVARTILRGKQHLSLVVPHGHSLLLYFIHFKEELRSEEQINVPKENIKAYKISDKELTTAVDLIENMSAAWQPEKYHNEYRDALQKWLDEQTKKIRPKGKKTQRATAPDAVVDFIALLKKSMSQSKKTHAPIKKRKF